MRKTIFVVDDSDTNLFKAAEVLSPNYNVITIPSALRMFTLLEKITPHLILLDISMPEMDGFEALQRLKSNHAHADIPVMFLTASQDDDSEAKGFEMGALDFIAKPFSAPVLLNRVKSIIGLSDIIIERTAQLEERTAQLEKANRGIILVLSDVVENRDENTGGHIERTTRYIKILVNEMIKRGLYAEALSKWSLEMIAAFTLLHDVGKIGVSDIILNKPGRLTDDEFDRMKDHVLNGERIINKVISRTGGSDFFDNVKLFTLYHHENWDGTGYPYRLKGEDIPIQGRIMAIADVYDALISKRSYKEALSHDEAVNIMMKESGKRFEPKIAEVFFDIKDQFAEVATSYNQNTLNQIHQLGSSRFVRIKK